MVHPTTHTSTYSPPSSTSSCLAQAERERYEARVARLAAEKRERERLFAVMRREEEEFNRARDLLVTQVWIFFFWCQSLVEFGQ